MTGLIQLTRLRTSLSAPLLTLVGWYITGNRASRIPHLLWGCASAFFVVALAQVFNDIRDFPHDVRVKPGRPIVSGLVTMTQARRVGVLAALASGVAALAAGAVTGILCLASGVMSLAYSLYIKSTILAGNLTVALLSASLVSFALSKSQLADTKAIFMEVLVFLFIFGNELFKTLLDRDGDAACGLRTMATQWSPAFSVRSIQAVAVVLAAEMLVQPWIIPGKGSFTILALMAVGGPAIISAMMLGLASMPTAPGAIMRAHRVWRLAWMPGLILGMLLR